MNTSSRTSPCSCQQLVQQLAGAAHERDALLVLVEARAPRPRTSGPRRRCRRRTPPACGSRAAGTACSRVPPCRARPGLPGDPRRSGPSPASLRAVAASVTTSRLWRTPLWGVFSLKQAATRLGSGPSSTSPRPPPGREDDPTDRHRSAVHAPARQRGGFRTPRPGAGRRSGPGRLRGGGTARPRRGPPRADVALLCVPDAEIRAAADGGVRFGPDGGHTSGATPVTALATAGADQFSLHPLQTFAGHETPRHLLGVGCAMAGSSPAALDVARELALSLGMLPVRALRRPPPRLPRRRLGGLELPGHAGGGRRADRRRRRPGGRPRPHPAGPAGAQHRRELGRAGPRAGPDRARRPRRRRDGGRSSAPQWPKPLPSCWGCST